MSACRILFFTLVAVSIAQVVYYYPALPDVMASHFDAGGSANGWSSRNVFFGIYLAMIALLIVVFILLPNWKLASGRFGLQVPNRDYWLAAERREQTLAFFRRQMAILGIAHLLLAIAATQLALLANLGQQLRLDDRIYWVLGIYSVFVSAWLIHFLLHFRKR
jgi:uncharacterized membrane protein